MPAQSTQVAPAAFSLADTAIREINGLYSLNDLHKASGGEEKHKPNRFLRNEQTQALITEIDNKINKSPNLGFSKSLVTKRGAEGGTYACREIVCAYAMWISAEVYLKVIRTFLAVSEKTLPSPYITDEQLVHIKQGVREMVYRTGKHWQAVYHELFDYVQAPSVREIKCERYADACHFLGISEKTRGLEERHLVPVDALPPAHIVMLPIDTRKDTRFEVEVRNGLVGLYENIRVNVHGVMNKPYGTLNKARWEA